MIHAGVPGDVHQRAHRAGFGVARPEHQRADTPVHHRACAHDAGLKRDIGGRAARLIARHTQRMDFSMRLAGAQVKAFADDNAVFHNHATHARVRMRGKASLARELKRARHVKFVRHQLIL